MAATERAKLIRIPVKTLKLVINRADMTDDGAASGHYTSVKTIPAGARVLGTRMQSTLGFTGDTTASVKVGKTGQDDDFAGAASTGFAAAQTTYGQPATEAEGQNAAATAVLVTITGATDFTLITAGRLIVDVHYIDLDAKPF